MATTRGVRMVIMHWGVFIAIATLHLCTPEMATGQSPRSVEAGFELGGTSFQLFAGVRSGRNTILVGRVLQSLEPRSESIACPAFGYLANARRVSVLRLPRSCKGATGVDVVETPLGIQALVQLQENGAPAGVHRLVLVTIDTAGSVAIEAASEPLQLVDAFPRRVTFFGNRRKALAIASLDKPTAGESPLVYLRQRGRELEASEFRLLGYDGVFFSGRSGDGSVFGVGQAADDAAISCTLVRLEVPSGSISDAKGHVRLPGGGCAGLTVESDGPRSWVVAETFGEAGIEVSAALADEAGRIRKVKSLKASSSGTAVAKHAGRLVVAGFGDGNQGRSAIAITQFAEGRDACTTTIDGPEMPTSLLLLRDDALTLAWFDLRDTGKAVTGIIRTRRILPCANARSGR